MFEWEDVRQSLEDGVTFWTVLSGFPKRLQRCFGHVSSEWETVRGSTRQQEASGKKGGMVVWFCVEMVLRPQLA